MSNEKPDGLDRSLAMLGIVVAHMAVIDKLSDGEICRYARETARAARRGFQQARAGASVGAVMDDFIKKERR